MFGQHRAWKGTEKYWGGGRRTQGKKGGLGRDSGTKPPLFPRGKTELKAGNMSRGLNLDGLGVKTLVMMSTRIQRVIPRKKDWRQVKGQGWKGPTTDFNMFPWGRGGPPKNEGPAQKHG